ncbi:MAG: helix-turn-helix domain-containing protein [Steroidobacteraceae bacterium]
MRAIRKQRNWSQTTLGKHVGATRATVSQWETGVIKNIRNAAFSRLASVLNCSEAYLLTGRENGTADTDKKRIDFLERTEASVQRNSLGKWVVWPGHGGGIVRGVADTLRAAIDLAIESTE